MPAKPTSGFPLVELAVVIAIVGLLLGSLLVPLANQIKGSKINETESELETIRDALLGYAMSNGALPCPYAFADGIDGLPAPLCPDPNVGFLPYTVLQVPPTDAWGHYYIYAVANVFTTPVGFTLLSTGNIAVYDRDAAKAEIPLTLNGASGAAAIVLSLGPDGAGAPNNANPTAGISTDWITPPNSSPTNVDAAENTQGFEIPIPGAPPGLGARFASRAPSEGAAACGDTPGSGANVPLCAFDDISVWISTPLFMARMVAAGVLP